MAYIIKPIVTEKMTGITEKLNQYGYNVHPETKKLQIKNEDEALDNVNEVSVKTMK
mgnify:CR=1 FL=1